MGYDNFARIFLVRDTYIQEITGYSCCFLGSNGEMIGGKEPAPAIEYRRKYRIKLTSRKGRFNLLEYLKGSESNKK